jgi:hypothetical protein
MTTHLSAQNTKNSQVPYVSALIGNFRGLLGEEDFYGAEDLAIAGVSNLIVQKHPPKSEVCTEAATSLAGSLLEVSLEFECNPLVARLLNSFDELLPGGLVQEAFANMTIRYGCEGLARRAPFHALNSMWWKTSPEEVEQRTAAINCAFAMINCDPLTRKRLSFSEVVDVIPERDFRHAIFLAKSIEISRTWPPKDCTAIMNFFKEYTPTKV